MDQIIGYFVTILTLISAIYFFLHLSHDRDGIPWNWPFVGMIPTLLFHLNRFPDRVTDFLQRSPRCTFLFKGIWFVNSDLLATADPENVNYIASTNFDNYPKGPDFQYIFDVLGEGIFRANSDSWKNQRNLAHSLISRKQFHRFITKISKLKIESGLAPVLEYVSIQGLVIDLQDLFERISFDLTSIMLSGFDPNSLSIDFKELPISKAMEDMEEMLFFRHFVPKFLWELQKFLGFGLAQKLSIAVETVHQTVDMFLIKKKEQLLHNKEDDGGDGISSDDLLTSHLNEDIMKSMGLRCDDKFLKDSTLNFLSAGRDTMSAALSWLFWLITKNPNVQSKIREELKSAIPKQSNIGAREKWRSFDIEEVNKLVYLHGALFETLRMYPPVPFNHKVSIERDVLPSGHHVNPNMKIIIPMYSMGRMKQVWGEDCLEFKPERWISDQGRIKHQPSYKFTAFFSGPRACLGKESALIQLKMIASSMIYNYKFELVDGQHVVPSPSVILRMKHGFKVRISKRRD